MDPCSTVEERRFSAASCALGGIGLQPPRKSFARCPRVCPEQATRAEECRKPQGNATETDHHRHMQHRGRAALQRRVQRFRRNRASAPVEVFRAGAPESALSKRRAPKSAASPRGMQLRPTTTDTCSTVEERRFSAASSVLGGIGLQPPWKSFARVPQSLP